jgi:hypothetical protein
MAWASVHTCVASETLPCQCLSVCHLPSSTFLNLTREEASSQSWPDTSPCVTGVREARICQQSPWGRFKAKNPWVTKGCKD